MSICNAEHSALSEQRTRDQLTRGLILFAASVRQATNGESLSKELAHRVTESQADALRFLALNESVTTGELAIGLGHTISGATKAVNRLEKNGWVERSHPPDDHRTVFVQLTSEGKKLADELLSQTEERLHRILTKLRPETLHLLGHVIEDFLTDSIDDKDVATKLCVACGFE
ncbi:MarR family transcriptional regulator, partial [bacterium]|nr:MarR family transcriptional regulator [bacterium]